MKLLILCLMFLMPLSSAYDTEVVIGRVDSRYHKVVVYSMAPGHVVHFTMRLSNYTNQNTRVILENVIVTRSSTLSDHLEISILNHAHHLDVHKPFSAIKLGHLKPDHTLDIPVTISIPSTVGNEIQGSRETITFIFYVSPIKSPCISVRCFGWVLALLLLSIFCILNNQYHRRRIQ